MYSLERDVKFQFFRLVSPLFQLFPVKTQHVVFPNYCVMTEGYTDPEADRGCLKYK